MRRLLLFILICWPLLFSGTICNVVVGGAAAAEEEVTGGLIGNSVGANDDSDTISANRGSWCSFTTTTAGQVSYIHVDMLFCYGTPKQINAGIYSADGSSKLAEGNLITIGSGAAIAHIPLDSAYTIVSATSYRLVVTTNTTDVAGINTTNISGTVYRDSSFTAGNTLDATCDQSSTAQTNYVLRIWATNTADGS